MNIKVLIILTDGFEEIEAITPIDILRRANIDVTVAGLTDIIIKGSHNIKVTADTLLDETKEDYDAIILPGGPGTKNLLISDKVISLVKKMNAEKKLCAAICAAPQVLAKAGALKEKRFTCFKGIDKLIKEGFFIKEKVVVSDNIITSRGAGTAIDFSLAIVEFLTDTSLADYTSKEILYTI